MKKIFVIVALIAVAVVIIGSAGVVYAQGSQPNNPPIGNGAGWLHDYIERALAGKLSLTEEQVEAEFAAGKTMVQVALDHGIAQDPIASFLTDVRTAAINAAVADGALTREQADWMLQHQQDNGYSYGLGTCPMRNGSYGLNNGAGFRGGTGNPMGSRSQNQQTNP